MKGRVIVLDTPKDRAFAAALMVNGRLDDLMLSPRLGDSRPMAGDICVVKVTRILPKAGAFCEMAQGQGYLRDAKSVKEGELILAQVQSLPEPGKAVSLTTRVLYKGPRVILTPGAPGVNVSKKIGNEAERARLQAAVEAVLADETLRPGSPGNVERVGAIIRTEARDAEPEDLHREVAVLIGHRLNALAGLKVHKKLGGGFGGSPHDAALRNWLFPVPDAIMMPHDMARVMTKPRDDPAGAAFEFYGDTRFIDRVDPEGAPFEAMGIWDEIEALKSPTVPLGEGSMVIEATRALVAVDVNTGSDFSPAAALKANLATARELPRQLRLRGLGGKIVVDFAPLPKSARRGVEDALKKAFRADPIETSLVGWTTLGLFELQRKRERWPLKELV
ncbi:MAG: ribonuclease E/G [Pseudomonadota bacterium]